MYHSCEGHNRLPYAGVNSGQLQTNRATCLILLINKRKLCGGAIHHKTKPKVSIKSQHFNKYFKTMCVELFT